MNTNGNTYTVIYSTVLVILVAAILAFVSMALKPRQDDNVKVETISKILTAANLYDAEAAAQKGNAYVLEQYQNCVASAEIINYEGKTLQTLTIKGEDGKPVIFDALKPQYDLMKKIADAQDKGQSESEINALKAQLRLPVYTFNSDGRKIRVVPCYGAGLWGPVWGYLAFEEDMNTLDGAVFDHKGETPGLGAEIAHEKFYSQFHGKQIYDQAGNFVSVKVVKGGAHGDINGVDAISGGTITSNALQNTIEQWLSFYVPYFKTIASENAAEQAGTDETGTNINAEE